MSALGQKTNIRRFLSGNLLRQNWGKERGAGTTLHLVAISEHLRIFVFDPIAERSLRNKQYKSMPKVSG